MRPATHATWSHLCPFGSACPSADARGEAAGKGCIKDFDPAKNSFPVE
ncbi:hypothetical protein ABZ557_26640 [Streptomyces sp. NPDC019645]